MSSFFYHQRLCFLFLGILAINGVFLSGCAGVPKKFDPNYSGPQVLVEPAAIRLSVTSLLSTDLRFKGKGFEPGDSVYVSVMEVEIADQKIDIPIAVGNIDENGDFVAHVDETIKLTELLRAQIGVNDDMKTIVMLTQPPIPEKVYKLRAFSMEHDHNQADCLLTVKGPSLADRFKDWIGVRMGKIQQ